MTPSNTKSVLYCSFCGKSQHEVRKLIAGPTVFICDECVGLCSEIIRDEHRDSELVGSAIPARTLELLEHVPVPVIQKLLSDGGLRKLDKQHPYTAREVIEAVLEGVERARTRINMTPERARAIKEAVQEFNEFTRKTQADYDRGVLPLRERIEALKRGEPIEGVSEVVALPEQAARLEAVGGTEIATLTRSGDLNDE